MKINRKLKNKKRLLERATSFYFFFKVLIELISNTFVNQNIAD